MVKQPSQKTSEPNTTIIPPSQPHYNPITPPLHHRNNPTITTPSHHHHNPITPPSQPHHHNPTTPPSQLHNTTIIPP
ncbi:hypothetical protein Pcinc_037286 [Petrolisthes cinctipes]|uniref:Uncharacterized protein n=1 Tax=Petrolisthes cinctipes TaxID=88211 RepID=A0AAE1BUB7_PETCI|nr:hypothetical protein Pcinc_037286 [Petrolisthes cinctipes]